MSRLLSMAAAISFVLAFPACLTRQAAGLRIGAGSSHISTDMQARPGTVQHSGTGASLGMSWQMEICPHVLLTASPEWIQKRYTMARTGVYTGIFTRYTNDYWQLPLSISMVQGQSWQAYGGIGGYMGYWCHAAIHGKTADLYSATDAVDAAGSTSETYRLVDYNSRSAFTPGQDRRFELGWTASAGIQHPVKSFTLFVEGCYYHSLTDQLTARQSPHFPQFNRTWGVYTGCRFSLKHHL